MSKLYINGTKQTSVAAGFILVLAVPIDFLMTVRKEEASICEQVMIELLNAYFQWFYF
jgi:hypothetical protein